MKQGPGKKILVVDDSEMVRNFHGYILRMFGFQADTAENGEAAFEKLLRDEYHLLVTDINMSKMDGYELLSKLQETGISVPVIIISTESEYKPGLIRTGAGRSIHLVKPTDSGKLVKTVKCFFRSKERIYYVQQNPY